MRTWGIHGGCVEGIKEVLNLLGVEGIRAVQDGCGASCVDGTASLPASTGQNSTTLSDIHPTHVKAPAHATTSRIVVLVSDGTASSGSPTSK